MEENRRAAPAARVAPAVLAAHAVTPAAAPAAVPVAVPAAALATPTAFEAPALYPPSEPAAGAVRRAPRVARETFEPEHVAMPDDEAPGRVAAAAAAQLEREWGGLGAGPQALAHAEAQLSPRVRGAAPLPACSSTPRAWGAAPPARAGGLQHPKRLKALEPRIAGGKVEAAEATEGAKGAEGAEDAEGGSFLEHWSARPEHGGGVTSRGASTPGRRLHGGAVRPLRGATSAPILMVVAPLAPVAPVALVAVGVLEPWFGDAELPAVLLSPGRAARHEDGGMPNLAIESQRERVPCPNALPHIGASRPQLSPRAAAAAVCSPPIGESGQQLSSLYL